MVSCLGNEACAKRKQSFLLRHQCNTALASWPRGKAPEFIVEWKQVRN